jgi:hypothetical protein
MLTNAIPIKGSVIPGVAGTGEEGGVDKKIGAE